MIRKSLLPAANLLTRLGKPVCADLVRWLDEYRNAHEEIDVHEWIGDLWYVVIMDTRIKDSYPAESLIGFTVDIKKDIIFWSNDRSYSPQFANGGNCFCRATRWWSRLREKFPNAKGDRRRNGIRDSVGSVHDYRSSEVKPEKVRA